MLDDTGLEPHYPKRRTPMPRALRVVLIVIGAVVGLAAAAGLAAAISHRSPGPVIVPASHHPLPPGGGGGDGPRPSHCTAPYAAALGRPTIRSATVLAFSNCNDDFSSDTNAFAAVVDASTPAGGQPRYVYTGMQYQCVEFARRALLGAFGVVFGDVVGAADIWRHDHVMSPDSLAAAPAGTLVPAPPMPVPDTGAPSAEALKRMMAQYAAMKRTAAHHHADTTPGDGDAREKPCGPTAAGGSGELCDRHRYPLLRYPSGAANATALPAAGSILIYPRQPGGFPFGHVAVVVSANVSAAGSGLAGTMLIAEQNWCSTFWPTANDGECPAGRRPPAMLAGHSRVLGLRRRAMGAPWEVVEPSGSRVDGWMTPVV